MQGVKRKTGDAAGANAPEGDVTVGMWHNIFNSDLKISGRSSPQSVHCCTCLQLLSHRFAALLMQARARASRE